MQVSRQKPLETDWEVLLLSKFGSSISIFKKTKNKKGWGWREDSVVKSTDFQRAQVQFPEPTNKGSQLPVTSVLGNTI